MPSETKKRSVPFFVSYSHEDRVLVLDLMKRLKPLFSLSKQFEFKGWLDDNILPGEGWFEAITNALKDADLALPFLSPNFFVSKFIGDHEIPGMVGKVIAPVALKPLDFQMLDLGIFNNLQCFLWESNPGLPRKAYSECRSSPEKDAFALALFKQIERRLGRDLK